MKNSVKIVLTVMALCLSIAVYYAKSINSETFANKAARIDPNLQKSPLKSVYDGYFSLKDALVETDATKTVTIASNLHKAIAAVQTEKLTQTEQAAWKETKNDLAAHSGHIENLKTIEEQRLHFSYLTESMYKLMKASKFETPVYYQYCPMYNNGNGGYWLSKDSTIKNPYFGTKMMTCGSTMETLK